MIKTILELQSLKKYYGNNGNITKAINGINIQILDGEFVGIMGTSGSGKTTLLNCIATIISPTEGKILLKGEDILNFNYKKLCEYRGRHIGYLFQNFELIDNLTGRENIMLPLAIHNMLDKEYEKRIDELSKYFKIDYIIDKFPSEMSGGEKQRVAMVRAVILKPQIVLADEPTGALDFENSKLLMKNLKDLNMKYKSTILMVTHDVNAASYCSRILFIQDGMVFHELRKKGEEESQQDFYERIILVMSKLGGGSANVL